MEFQGWEQMAASNSAKEDRACVIPGRAAGWAPHTKARGSSPKEIWASPYPSTPAELVDGPSMTRQPESVTQPEERIASDGPNVPEGPNVDHAATPTEGSPGPEDTSLRAKPEQRPVGNHVDHPVCVIHQTDTID